MVKVFWILFGVVGYYLVVKYIFVWLDNEVGEFVFVIIEIVVEMLFLGLIFFNIVGEFVEGEILIV